MGQKDTLLLLHEVGGYATVNELAEFAISYYDDVQLARGISSDLQGLKRWESVNYDVKTKIWSIQN